MKHVFATVTASQVAAATFPANERTPEDVICSAGTFHPSSHGRRSFPVSLGQQLNPTLDLAKE